MKPGDVVQLADISGTRPGDSVEIRGKKWLLLAVSETRITIQPRTRWNVFCWVMAHPVKAWKFYRRSGR